MTETLEWPVEKILSQWTIAQNAFFILFLFYFFINMQVLGGSRKLLAPMLHSLFRRRDRQSISSETVNNEFLVKSILCLQTVVMASILIYGRLSHQWDIPFETTGQLVSLLGAIALVILIFILYKLLTNLVIGFIFFQQEDVRLWNNLFFSVICLSGIVLFIPAVLIFYFPKAYYVCFYFFLLYFIVVEIFMISKIFEIFFKQISALLYFILYLCAQVLLPLFFAYKALVLFIGCK